MLVGVADATGVTGATLVLLSVLLWVVAAGETNDMAVVEALGEIKELSETTDDDEEEAVAVVTVG